MREPVPEPPLPMLSADPLRAALALFLAEVLGCVLCQGDSEPLLFDFIAESAVRLDADDAPLANFHLVFLYRLLGFLGVAPDFGGYEAGMVFDMVDARFRRSAPLHGKFLGAADSAVAAAFGRITWRNAHHYKYTRAQRARVLDSLLEYYSLHVVALSSLKSVAVLRDLFN